MLKTIIIRNLFISITIWLSSVAYISAVPALPNLMAKFKAYLRGDEYFSWWESEKGVVLFRNLESGYFEYAKISMIDEKEELVPTGIIFVSGEEPSFSNLQEILKKQKQSRNQ